MTKYNIFATVVALSLLSTANAAEFQATQVAREAPDNVRLILENDDVAVMEFKLDPGEALPAHVGGHRVVLSLSEYIIRYTEDGKTWVQQWKDGNVHWHESNTHAVENAGTTPAHYIVVACKTPQHSGGAVEIDGVTLSEVAPGSARVVLENDDVLVSHVTLAPGEAIAEHGGHKRVIYALSSYTLEYTDAEGTRTKSQSEGSVHWHDASTHRLRNTGKSEASYYVVAWKR